MKKIEKLAAALVVMAAAIGIMGCAQPSAGSATVYTATYQFTESVQALPAETDGTAGTSATYVKFGDWPQSEAASGVKFSTLPESNGYYVGSDGNYYAKVTVVTKDSNHCEYAAGDIKYFKVEPIKWLVLDTAYDYDGSTGSETAKLLLAENILTSNVPYYYAYSDTRSVGTDTTIHPNNYKYSQIRAYLNGLSYYNNSNSAVNTYAGKGFLQKAFTETARNAIKTTVVNNKEDSTTNYDTSNGTLTKATTYACENTNDKIFLLSEYEVTKYSTEAYNAGGEGNSRIRKTTAYARANNAFQGSTNGYGGYWWLRSPSDKDSSIAWRIYRDGKANNYHGVNHAYNGVVPALSIAF